MKLYKAGKVRVVREQTTAPHGHLIELGHEVVRGGRSRENGRRLNRVQRGVRGISSGGRVEGRHMLERSLSEANGSFKGNVEKMLDSLTGDLRT